jgi:hypothetical protein
MEGRRWCAKRRIINSLRRKVSPKAEIDASPLMGRRTVLGFFVFISGLYPGILC